MDEEMRLEKLAELQVVQTSAKSWQTSVLHTLGWSAEHLLQKDVDLEACPYDPGHCMPASTQDRHATHCMLHKKGYTAHEVEATNVATSAIYGSTTSVATIKIDDESFQKILQTCPGAIPPIPGRASVKRDMPLTMDRAVTDLSQSERLAIYEYCISQAKEMDKPVTIPEEDLMLIQDKKEGDERKKMSVLERRAMERDMKRRRQSYRAKNVHTTKKSHTEILNEVITRQMELLEQMYHDEQEEAIRQTRRDRREQDELARSRHPKPSHQYDRLSSRDRTYHSEGSSVMRESPVRSKRAQEEKERRDSDSENASSCKNEETRDNPERHRHKKHKKHKHKKYHKRERSSPSTPRE